MKTEEKNQTPGCVTTIGGKELLAAMQRRQIEPKDVAKELGLRTATI